MGDVRRPRQEQDQPTLLKTPAQAAGLLTDAWSTSAPELPPEPATGPTADRDLLADAWSLTPPAPAPAADPGDTTVTPPANPAPAPDPDDAVVGLRKAQQNHLPDITLAALRWARANDPDFPASVDKRGAELLYRAGDLKKWARNRPRAGTTDPG